jgi:hypothetical protein
LFVCLSGEAVVTWLLVLEMELVKLCHLLFVVVVAAVACLFVGLLIL